MFHRRTFLFMVPLAGILSNFEQALFSPAAAQGAAGSREALDALKRRASALGLGGPVPETAAPISEAFADLMPPLVELTADLRERLAAGAIPNADAARRLLDDAGALLRALTVAERTPTVWLAPEAVPPSFESLREDYDALFQRFTIRPEHKGKVAWHIKMLRRESSRAMYEEVQRRTTIPWYFVGIIHALEGSFDFQTHLHNGDSLQFRTQNVPEGRLPNSLPPYDWTTSAVDALTLKKFNAEQGWSTAQMLYRLEQYNGFSSRAHGVNTAYLWSFSSEYSKGKFIRDHVWDPEFVSGQCGAALMLKGLDTAGVIQLPH